MKKLVSAFLVLLCFPAFASAQFATPSVGGGTSDSIGVDLDNDGMDQWLFPAYLREGSNVTFSITGDTLTISGPAAGGTQDTTWLHNSANDDSIAGLSDHVHLLWGTTLTADINGDSTTAHVDTTEDFLWTTTHTFKPNSAVQGVVIDQDNNQEGLYIDSEASTRYALNASGIYAGGFSQDIANGYGLWVYRNNANAELYALARITNDNATDTKASLSLQNDGSGPHITTGATNENLEIDPNGTGGTVFTGDVTIADASLIITGDDNADILISDGTNYSHQAISGDGTITNAGVLDITFADSSTQLSHDYIRDWHFAEDDWGEISVSATNVVTLDADVVDESKIADDGIDSEHYNDGSIDAVHLAADVIDETKIADDGINSEHYNDGSIDLVHLAAGVYAKDLVATSPLLVDGGAATNNILVGAEGDVTISATIAKDIVATSPLTVNAGASLNDVIIGTDADITVAINDADDDGTTKGAASFDNTDFDATAGNVTIVDDGHLHTTTSISGLDVSADLNLTAGDHITLTDDDLDVDDDFLLNTGDIGTGTYNFGGATTLEIPNATDPSTGTEEGMIAWDINDNALEVYDGSKARLITSPLEHFHATIYNPDGIQSVEDAIPLLAVEIEWAPHGITLVDLGIKTDAASTYSVNFEEWVSPTDGSPSTIEAVATSASTEAEDDGTLTDAAIAAGSIIYADLPSTDINMLTIWGTFYLNPGD